MAKNLLISIPQPCHENWAGMTPDEKGRHCSSCNKVVVDFTSMTDAQLAEYFKANIGKTCGHFRTDQLNRKMRIEPIEKPLFPFKYLAASLVATGGLWPLANAYDTHDTINRIELTEKRADDSTCTEAGVDSCKTADIDTTKPDSHVIIGDTVADYSFPIKKDTIIFTEISGNTAVTLGFCTMPEDPTPEFDPKPIAPFRIPYIGPVLESWTNRTNTTPKDEKPTKKQFNFSFAALINRLRLRNMPPKDEQK